MTRKEALEEVLYLASVGFNSLTNIVTADDAATYKEAIAIVEEMADAAAGSEGVCRCDPASHRYVSTCPIHGERGMRCGEG